MNRFARKAKCTCGKVYVVPHEVEGGTRKCFFCGESYLIPESRRPSRLDSTPRGRHARTVEAYNRARCRLETRRINISALLERSVG